MIQILSDAALRAASLTAAFDFEARAQALLAAARSLLPALMLALACPAGGDCLSQAANPAVRSSIISAREADRDNGGSKGEGSNSMWGGRFAAGPEIGRAHV